MATVSTCTCACVCMCSYMHQLTLNSGSITPQDNAIGNDDGIWPKCVCGGGDNR